MTAQRRRKHKYANLLDRFWYHWEHNKIVSLGLHVKAIMQFPRLHPCRNCPACKALFHWIGCEDLYTP